MMWLFDSFCKVVAASVFLSLTLLVATLALLFIYNEPYQAAAIGATLVVLAVTVRGILLIEV